jgi:ribosomal protein S27AE
MKDGTSIDHALSILKEMSDRLPSDFTLSLTTDKKDLFIRSRATIQYRGGFKYIFDHSFKLQEHPNIDCLLVATESIMAAYNSFNQKIFEDNQWKKVNSTAFITPDNQMDYENGFLCPKCGSTTTTFRHPWAKRWCDKCNYVLRPDGDRTPYNYLDHISV